MRFTDGKSWRKDDKIEVNCINIPSRSEYNTNEINGKFKIMSLKWDEHYKNPQSLKYKTLANTIESDIRKAAVHLKLLSLKRVEDQLVLVLYQTMQ